MIPGCHLYVKLGAGEVTVNVETVFRGKSCLLRQIEDAWAISVAPLLWDGQVDLVCRPCRATESAGGQSPRAGAAANQRSADMMFLHAARTPSFCCFDFRGSRAQTSAN